MLEFTGRLIEEVLESWRKWGVLEKDKKKIQDHLTIVRILKERGVKGSGIIGAYHTWRVAPLMKRALPLHMMAPEVLLDVRKMDPWPIYFGFGCLMTNTTKLD